MLFHDIVDEARLAPSVHNTQPARWIFGSGNVVDIVADRSRMLAVSDPESHDAGVSCGTATEATINALARKGLEVTKVTDNWANNNGPAGYRCAARIEWRSGTPDIIPLSVVKSRQTWRGGFAPLVSPYASEVADRLRQDPNVVLVDDAATISFLADLGDEAAVRVMKAPGYRKELLECMRLTPGHPRVAFDGMDLTAMAMSRLEGMGAGLVLRSPFWEALDAAKIAPLLVAEKAKTKTSAFIAVLHGAEGQSPVQSGRDLHRFWTAAAAEGLSGWPLSAIVDDEDARAKCRLAVIHPAGRRIHSVLRLGIMPSGSVAPPKARLKVEGLILS